MNKNITYSNPCIDETALELLSRLEVRATIVFRGPTEAYMVMDLNFAEVLCRWFRPPLNQWADMRVDILCAEIENWNNDSRFIRNRNLSPEQVNNLQNMMMQRIERINNGDLSQEFVRFMIRNPRATGIGIWLDTGRILNDQRPLIPLIRPNRPD